ncbi:MAG: GatB/YqeY domain-containing protein [Candidatus Limnocylindria bacterium]
MKERDQVRRDTLRLALSAVHYEEVASGAPLGADALEQLLRKQARSRRESIEAFAKAGRGELVAKERAELAVIEGYLPPQLDRDAIRSAADRAIAQSGAAGPADQGKVMRAVMGELRGKADGKLVAEVVSEQLARRAG